MKRDYSITFYSQDRNIILARDVKDVLENKNRGVLNIDSLDEFFINRNSSIRHIVLDLIVTPLDNRSCSLIKLMLNSKLIDTVIMIVPEGINYGSEFMYVHPGESFKSDLSILFDKVFDKEDIKERFLSSTWRSAISKQLCDWGFSSKCNGFSMLIDTIIYYIQKKCVVRKLSKEVYVILSHKYAVTPACVELSIRKAIQNACKIEDKFPENCAVTNKGFIVYSVSQLYDKLVNVEGRLY